MELSKPLTLEEVQEAADIFLPLFEEVHDRLKLANCNLRSPSIEDTLKVMEHICKLAQHCLLYTSPSPRDKRQSRMPSSA